MKGIKKNWFLLLMLCTSIAWLNCNGDDNGGGAIDPNDPSTFVGTWDIISLTDKTGLGFELPPGTMLTAGEPTDIGGGILVTIDGTIVLNSSDYTLTIDLTIEIPNVGTQTDQETDSGTWSISGGQFTIDSADSEPETGTFTVDGNRVTIETDDVIIVIEKR